MAIRVIVNRIANPQNIMNCGTFKGRPSCNFKESINFESFMIERRFCHHDPVEYEYEYRCTEYEYDCPDELSGSAAGEAPSSLATMATPAR
jgi:hypothetical protein